ncbi:MAG: hypothetical protein AAB091_07080 [Elusimicrobiota bacterium]
MPPKKKSSAQPFGLRAFQEILERTLDALEQRVTGRLKNDLATKEDIQAIRDDMATKEDLRRLETKIDGMLTRQEFLNVFERYTKLHQKTHVTIEERLIKIESTIPVN